MLELALPQTRVSQRVPPDLRPLHSALSHTSAVLSVLETCQTTAASYGGGAWIAACVKPQSRTYVAGRRRVCETSLQCTLDDMAHTARAHVLDEGPLARGIVARWGDPHADATPVAHNDYVQAELAAGESCYGLLRVARPSTDLAQECDWEAIEGVMCAAVPYVILCLERDGRDGRLDPVTGLHLPAEFAMIMAREVERARMYPVQLALVMMELRLGDGRNSGELTDTELHVIGRAIRTSLRETDVASRMPDGTFALLLPATSQRNALTTSARLTDELQACPELPDELDWQIGISGWPSDGPSVADMMSGASGALRGARLAGSRGAFLAL